LSAIVEDQQRSGHRKTDREKLSSTSLGSPADALLWEVHVVDDDGLSLDDLVGAWEMEWVETTTEDGTTTLTRPPEISGVIT
jgi:hypothetical protein